METCSLLARGMPVDAPDAWGDTALHLAARVPWRSGGQVARCSKPVDLNSIPTVVGLGEWLNIHKTSEGLSCSSKGWLHGRLCNPVRGSRQPAAAEQGQEDSSRGGTHCRAPRGIRTLAGGGLKQL